MSNTKKNLLKKMFGYITDAVKDLSKSKYGSI